MALRISLTREDINAGKLLKPGWYLCKIKDVVEGKSKNDQSTNYIFTFTVQEDGEYKGTAVKQWVNEKFMTPMVGIIEALTGQEYREDTPVDIESFIGHDIRVKIVTGDYNGRPTNNVDGYKAA